MIAMRSGAALALLLSGCLHPTVQECSGGGQTWVCPSEQACAQPPTFCSTPNEVGACQGKVDNDPCSSSLVADGICEAGACTSCSVDIAACRYVGWKPMTSGTTADLTAIAFTKFGEAYVGTTAGEIRHYLTSGWTTVDFGMPDVTQVLALQTSGTRVYALLGVSSSGNKRVAYLENGTWTALPGLTAGALYTAMWVAPTGDVFLAGAAAVAARFDGTAWSETMLTTTPANQTLTAVWGTAANDVYVVGNKHTILHFNGTTWTANTSPGAATDNYSAVWGTGSDVFVAGAVPGTTATGIAHSVGGGTFTAMPAPAITMGSRAMWGSSATDVWLVGDGGPGNASVAVISHWDGVSWTQLQAPTQSLLAAVAGSGADEIFTVGTAGTVLRYTGSAWAVLASPPSVSALTDVWAAAPNELFVVGNGAHHLATDRTWHSSAGVYQAVTGRGPTDVVAVGTNASSQWNGAAFPTATGANIGIMSDLAATPDAYVGLSVSLYTSPTGSTWTPHVLMPPQTGSHALWIAPSGTVWLASEAGVIGVDSSYVATVATTGSFAGIWGSGENDIYAVGTNDVRHYDGTTWTAMTLPTQAKLEGVWGRGADDVFAVGVNRTVLHYHAGLWKPLETPFSSGDLGAISGAGNSVFMTSLDGKVFQLVETAP